MVCYDTPYEASSAIGILLTSFLAALNGYIYGGRALRLNLDRFAGSIKK